VLTDILEDSDAFIFYPEDEGSMFPPEMSAPILCPHIAEDVYLMMYSWILT
jgi:hypothetical protein